MIYFVSSSHWFGQWGSFLHHGSATGSQHLQSVMAAGHNLLQLDLARTASAQRARPIYCQSLCPSCPSEEHCLNAFSRQTQEVFAYHQHKNVSVGMCWGTFDSTPGMVFRLCFSDTFQTLAAHVPSKASHF